jgi:hypothetical protein
MSGNNILDIENASSIRRPTQIDSYTFTKFYDVNQGSQISAQPTMFQFRNNNMFDWFDFGNGQIVLRWQLNLIDKRHASTIKSDIRSAFIERAELRANGTLITENNHYHKWADYSRSQFSREYYDTIGSDMMCYDNFEWDGANLTYNPATDAQLTTITERPLPVAVAAAGAPVVSRASNYTNSQLSGFGKRVTLTFQKALATDGDTTGRVVTATIPFRHLFPFFGSLRSCLKNVQFDITLHLRDNNLMFETFENLGGASPAGTVINFKEAYMEIPKVTPSALRLIELDKFLYSSPKLNISYPNFKVLRNDLSLNVRNQNIMIDNIAQRMLRVTLWITRKTKDQPNIVVIDPTLSVRNLIRNLQFFVNSIPVPNTRINTIQGDQAGTDMIGANQDWDTHDIYRNYMESCGAFYENNPFSTSNGLVQRFRNTGVYSNLGFSTFFPYYTVPLDRSRNSEEYISGSSQLSVQIEMEDVTELGDYNVWTIIEFQDNIRFQMEPTNAFVTYLGNNGDNPDGEN